MSSSDKERFSPVTSSHVPVQEVWDNDRHGRKYTGFLGTIHKFFYRLSTVAQDEGMGNFNRFKHSLHVYVKNKNK